MSARDDVEMRAVSSPISVIPSFHFVLYYFVLFCSLPVLRVKVIECSAKDDINILECFRTIVSLSRVLHTDGKDEDGTSGLKRRSSAYVSATSKGQFYQIHKFTNKFKIIQ